MVKGGGWEDGQKDGCLEIHPCVLQDIGPLGPLPKKGRLGLGPEAFLGHLCISASA